MSKTKVKENVNEVISDVKDEVGETVESVLESFEETSTKKNIKTFGLVAAGMAAVGAIGYGVVKLFSKFRGNDLDCYPDHPEED